MILKSRASIVPVIVRLVTVFSSFAVKTVDKVPAVLMSIVFVTCACNIRARLRINRSVTNFFIKIVLMGYFVWKFSIFLARFSAAAPSSFSDFRAYSVWF